MDTVERDVSLPSGVNLAGDLDDRDTSRGSFAKRLARYSAAHLRTTQILDYIRANHAKEAKLIAALDDCGNYLVFRDYFTIGEIRLSQASFCRKHLLCPLCAIRRGAKVLQKYLSLYDHVRTLNPSLRPYMVTLTVKDGPDLKERFNHLTKALKQFHKRRHLTKGVCEARKAQGALWSYEVKRGKNSGAWHPHVHCIWLCESAPDQKAISDQWRTITGDSFIVDSRPINPEDPIDGFLEVLKYAVKFSDQPEEDTWHCYQTLSGKRLIGSFGCMYGVEIPEEMTDLQFEELPYILRFFQFINGKYTQS